MPQQRSPQAGAVLALLKSISGHYTLSGQHNYISTGTLYTDKVEAAVGRRPVV